MSSRGEASAAKALDPTTAPHTEHPISTTPTRVVALRKGAEAPDIRIKPIPPSKRLRMMVGTLPHLSRSMPKTGNATRLNVLIIIMGTAPLKEAASELNP
jgi:hypothetical protein